MVGHTPPTFKSLHQHLPPRPLPWLLNSEFFPSLDFYRSPHSIQTDHFKAYTSSLYSCVHNSRSSHCCLCPGISYSQAFSFSVSRISAQKERSSNLLCTLRASLSHPFQYQYICLFFRSSNHYMTLFCSFSHFIYPHPKNVNSITRPLPVSLDTSLPL